MPRIDVILDSANDLQIRGNDFFLGSSDIQYVNDIVEAGPGHYKETPLIGVYAAQFQQGPIDIPTITREIKTHIASDGYLSSKIAIDKVTGEIKVGV